MELAAGLLLPFLGTALGAACVFFLKDELNRLVQKGASWLCIGRDGGGFGVVASDSGNRDGSACDGKVFLCACGSGIC